MGSDSIFTVGAEGVDVTKLVDGIKAAVAEKRARGEYADPRVTRAERTNLVHLRNDAEFLSFYMQCLREAVQVDINDFTIVERRQRFARPLVAMKRQIWNVLKFYTYRLWSQQNQANALLLTAIEDTQNRYKDKIQELEDRISKLESGKR
ncbi:MAG: hypothetical protein C0404_14900 [Verrucomicrobia bacterium]|nr:hypothetical protein [Verrucomicrobiota bacterium]